MGKKKKFVYIAVLAIAAIVAYFIIAGQNNTHASSFMPPIGAKAPNYEFVYSSNGTVANVSSLRGTPVLLWFVATWCSGCAVGNEMLNGNMSYFKSHGIKVIEVELYNDLGYSGAPIASFVSDYAPAAEKYSNFESAVSSYGLTLAYDKDGYLDVYYLIGPNGDIVYENDGSLAATMPQLKDKINSLPNIL
ncbi:MAG: redoxin domain-containing protein [Candidatus Micrarchaeales archaeon]|jgi:thiol-disulfide isomerase/thioredoxin|nr:redoxin domain-containing protein [Candidatus Micrarchaeales archaeon]